MKQVFVLFRTVNGTKEIKGVYLEKHKAAGQQVYEILKENQEPESKVEYSYEAVKLFQPPARAKKESAKSNGRVKAGSVKVEA